MSGPVSESGASVVERDTRRVLPVSEMWAGVNG